MIKVAEAAARLEVTTARIQQLCRAQRIPGARLHGRIWLIPENFTVRPGKRGPKRTP